MAQINLSDEEVLALRWMLDKWALDSQTQQNCPFVYHYGIIALQSLGGEIKDNEIPGQGLWDHPLAINFYAERENCASCNNFLKKEDMKYYEDYDGMVCKSCQE